MPGDALAAGNVAQSHPTFDVWWKLLSSFTAFPNTCQKQGLPDSNKYDLDIMHGRVSTAAQLPQPRRNVVCLSDSRVSRPETVGRSLGPVCWMTPPP
jgi:hypothetical protein